MPTQKQKELALAQTQAEAEQTLETSQEQAIRQELVDARSAALTALTSGETKMAALLAEIDFFLSTPFMSKKYGAEQGAVFTVIRAGMKDSESMESPGVSVTQHVYGVVLQNDVEYVDNAGEMREFAKGSMALIAFNQNPVRDQVADMVRSILEEDGAVPNMSLDFVPLSAKSKAKGWSRAVRFVPARKAS